MTRVTALIFFLVVSADLSFSQTSLAINERAIAPSESTQISGSGFADAETVDLYFDRVDVAVVKTEAGGVFRGHLTTPSDAKTGLHWITAVGRQSGSTEQTQVKVEYQWRQYHADPRRDGYNTTENILNVSNVNQLQMKWDVPLGFGTSSPAVVNGILYIGSYDFRLHAYDAQTGTPLWEAPTRSYIDSSPSEQDGRVFIGSDDGAAYAFDAKNGKQIWSMAFGLDFATSAAVANGLVYFGSLDHNLYAFDPATGKVVWQQSTGGEILYSSPAVTQDTAYIGSLDGNLYAFDALTGDPKWNVNIGAALQSSPSVKDGIVYIGADNLYAFDAASGKALWTASTGGVDYSSPAVADGVVLIGGDKLYAFNATTGQSLWSTSVGASITDPPTVANGVVYAGSGSDAGTSSGSIYAFDLATGTTLWSFATGGYIFATPAVLNGMVYVSSESANVYAFALPSNGNPDGAASAAPDAAALKPNLTLIP